MPEPVYSIKLFYGDMKFTNDYSNVLQFNSKELRDAYFDGFDNSFEIVNTEANRVMFDGGSIKIALPLQCFNKLDMINYCYINYALVDGDSYEQNRKYYFVNSYEIISSSEDVTVVEFTIEYDVWQNNQFDFIFRESNVERMHVDRWDNNGYIKYTRPILDAIESNSKIDKSYAIEETLYANVDLHGYKHICAIIWVMITASHTFGANTDKLLYHFIPIVYSSVDLSFIHFNPRIPDFYYQNAIKVGVTSTSTEVYFPSIQGIDSAILSFACGNGFNKDVVKILNVQFFNWLPLKLVYESKEGFLDTVAIVKTLDDTPLEIYYNSPIFTPSMSFPLMCSYATGDLTLFGELGSQLTKTHSYTEFSKPTKPNDNDNYSSSHEPALYMSPIRKRYIVMGDLSSMSEIPDILFIKNMFNKANKVLELNERISFSSISAYCYFTIGDTRINNNMEGFAIIKQSYLGDILSDAWVDYVVQQRDSDRAMMWTNILTGGISEAGSTIISAGIGWRSNTERAYSLANSGKFAKSQENYYNRTLPNKERAQFYSKLQRHQINPNVRMYGGMANNAMVMSGIGGVTAFSANAIHQSIAQRMKEKSIINTPGTLAKSGNAIGSIIDNQFRMYYIESIVDDVSFDKYKIMFMKYGYYIGTVELPNIYSRKFFNYIKTNGAILTGNCNNLILSYLASIFDNGVTIWHMDYTTYSTIYDYTKENIERSLM